MLISPHTLQNRLGIPISDSFVVCFCILNDNEDTTESIVRRLVPSFISELLILSILCSLSDGCRFDEE